MGIPKFFRWLTRRYPMILQAVNQLEDVPPIGKHPFDLLFCRQFVSWSQRYRSLSYSRQWSKATWTHQQAWRFGGALGINYEVDWRACSCDKTQESPVFGRWWSRTQGQDESTTSPSLQICKGKRNADQPIESPGQERSWDVRHKRDFSWHRVHGQSMQPITLFP